MAQVPDGLADELRSSIKELARLTTSESASQATVTVTVAGTTMDLNPLETNAVHLAIMDDDLSNSDPISALIAGAASLRFKTLSDLASNTDADAAAAAGTALALDRDIELGEVVCGSLIQVSKDFSDAGEAEAGRSVSSASNALEEILTRARQVMAGSADEPLVTPPAEEPEVTVEEPKKSSAKGGLMVAIAIILGLTIGFSVHYWMQRESPLPSFSFSDFSGVPAVEQVVNRAPDLIVVVADDGWDALSADQKKQAITEIVNKASTAGYKRAEIRSTTRQNLAGWTKGSDPKVTE